MTHRFASTVRALTAVAASTALLATMTPPAFAERISVPMACRATPAIKAAAQDYKAAGINVTVQSPPRVAVGDTFDVSFHIHPVRIKLHIPPMGARFVDASRMKLDLAIPDGLTLVNAKVTADNNNLHGFTAKQVNEQGVPDPHGHILRLVSADNATIGQSPNSATNSVGGVVFPVDQMTLHITFPKVTATFKATEPGRQALTVNTRGAAGQYDNDSDFFTLLSHVTAPVVGDVWIVNRCTPTTDKNAPIDPSRTLIAAVDVTARSSAPSAAPGGDLSPATSTPASTGDQADATSDEEPSDDYTQNLGVVAQSVLAYPELLPLLADAG